MAQPSVSNLQRWVAELGEAGVALSPHTVASYERRWRQWQAFADHHAVSALPADEVHVGAFAVARLRAGVSASGVAANLSAVGWFHDQLDPPVENVTGLAKRAVRRLRGDGADKPLVPAPVLSVGALVAMVTCPARGVRRRSAKLVRQLSGATPRQLMVLERDDIEVSADAVELRLRGFPARGRSGASSGGMVRLEAGRTLLDCPVEAMRSLLVEAGDGPIFPAKLVQRGSVDDWDPFDPGEGVPLRLAARNRALVAVGYAGALRTGDLSRARVEHLQPSWQGYRLVLPESKTNRDGSVQAVVLDRTDDPLDPVAALDRWLAVRGDHDGPLFASIHHSNGDLAMTAGEVRSVLDGLARQVGLPPTVSGHSLRRSWATHTYLRDRDSIGWISLQLRHSSIENTLRYIENLTLHLIDPVDLLSPEVVIAGPGGQVAPAKNLGFDQAPLGELVDAVLDATRSESEWLAPNTLRPFASYWGTWERWAKSFGFEVFPADPRHVLMFAAARASEGIAPNTLRGQLRAMEVVHADNGFPAVGFVRLASEIIAGVEHTRRRPRRQAPVVPLGDLRNMAAWALEHAQDSDEFLRDYLMVCVGYGGGLRLDDLHRARLENLERFASGYVLRLSASKLNQAGRRVEGARLDRRDDELDPVAAIETWKDRTGLSRGPLIPALPEAQRSISHDTMRDRLARLALRSGSSVRPTGHSLRRSWSTHAYDAGLDLVSIAWQLRHENLEMTKGYIETLNTWRDNPSRLLHEDTEP